MKSENLYMFKEIDGLDSTKNFNSVNNECLLILHYKSIDKPRPHIVQKSVEVLRLLHTVTIRLTATAQNIFKFEFFSSSGISLSPQTYWNHFLIQRTHNTCIFICSLLRNSSVIPRLLQWKLLSRLLFFGKYIVCYPALHSIDWVPFVESYKL